MEQLVLLLIIGAISLINWLIEQSGKRREQRRFEAERARREAEANPYLEPEPAAPIPVPEAREPAPQQEMRRLLEAFGIPVPEESAPQALPSEIPAPASEPTPVFASAPITMPEPRPVIAKTKPTPSSPRKAPLEIKSPAALRQAIIWREILGPPRSLQPH
jgi:fused signal recognition particle receptor